MLSGQSVTGLAGLDHGPEFDVHMRKPKGGGFQTMGLTKDELKSVLGMGFTVPTPIQRKAIPVLMQGNDVVGMARTGSGKTAAYVVPMIHRLAEHSTMVGIRGVIMSPTRELALQIMREMQKLSKHTNLRYCALVGGNSLEEQFARLTENPDVVIATPGRLLHILEETKLALTAMKVVVLDEADRLFEQGLQPQLTAILNRVPDECQRSLFSATMPSILAEFTDARLHNPVVIRLDSETKLSDTLRQSAFFVRSSEKPAALIYMLREVLGVDAKTSQALIFVESKYHVEFFVSLLNELQISTVGVHGGMDQDARRDAVEQFSRRKVSAMIVTDVAARGIDLPLLDNVINYSFPAVPKIFIHRVGRVARAGRSGSAYSLLTYDDMPYYVDLMDFIGRPLQTTPEEGAPVDLLYNPEDGCYGRISDASIHQNVEYIKNIVAAFPDLASLFKVMERAHGKFTRTKKKASGASIREARQDSDLRLENMPLHPMFAAKQSAAAKKQYDALKALRGFKARDTFLDIVHGGKVFEMKPRVTLQSLRHDSEAEATEGSSSRLVSASGAPKRNNPSGRREAMASRLDQEAGDDDESTPAAAPSGKPKSLAERLLVQAREKRHRTEEDQGAESEFARTTTSRPGRRVESSADEEKYHDREFFMPTVREETMHDQHYSVRDAAVDLVADTSEDLRKQRSVFTWNKKKNKFVKTGINEAKALLVGIKNESGKAIDFKTKLEAYTKWTRTANLRIQDVGEQEDSAVLERARALKMNGGKLSVVDAGDDDGGEVDISDPNQGRKLKLPKKLKTMPKEGQTRSFEDLQQIKRQKSKEKAKAEAIRAKKARKGIKPKGGKRK